MSKYDTAGWHLIHTDGTGALVTGQDGVTLTSDNVTGIWKLTADANTTDANAYARIANDYPLTANNWTAGDATNLEANTVYWVKTDPITPQSSSVFLRTSSDGNSVEYKLADSVTSLNSIKLYFQDAFTHNPQRNMNALFASPAWAFTANVDEKSVVMYSTAASTYFTSKDWAPLYFLASGVTNTLISANNATNVDVAIPDNEISIA